LKTRLDAKGVTKCVIEPDVRSANPAVIRTIIKHPSLIGGLSHDRIMVQRFAKLDGTVRGKCTDR
jgi:hypothetical protein